MRPLRLTIEGFSAFRDRVDVDFEGADLFALVGSTGAGKSSLIDAMVFALYGTVPRLDKRLVHPVITQGRAQARVRFDFAVGDETFTAVRVVKRTSRGATTPEARLERAGEVLAGSARELDAEVERLLGLSFSQFTTCVVLPQGDFARLLHDTAADRQDLLIRLLDLGLYRRLGQAARARAAGAEEGVRQMDAQLAELGDVGPEQLATLRARVAVLDALCAELADAEPREAAIAEAIEVAAAELARLDEQLGRLGQVVVPADLGDLATEVSHAEARVDDATAAETAAAAAVDDARAAAGALVPRHELERAGDLHERAAALEQLVVKGEATQAAAAAACAEAETAAASARTVHEEAAATLDAARLADRAGHLRAHLVAGAPCPVCRQEVAVVPAERDAGVDAAEAAVRRAEGDVREAAARLDAARSEEARVVAKLETVRAELADVASRLADAPPPEEIVAGLAAADAAAAAVTAAEAAQRAARAALTAAQRHAADLAQRERAAWQAFDAARDAVAVLAPPPAERSDLAAAWAGLTAWVADVVPTVEAARAGALAQRTAREADRATLRRFLADACAAAGVVVGGDQPRAAAEAARTAAVVDVTRLEAKVDEIERLGARRATLDEQRSVATLLGRLLRADGFEKWLLDEAFGRLLEGATATLLQLSGGQYSLTLDDKREHFVVVDHHAADERRLARTLSGGETFLASLALALALAEQVADLSAEGAPKLESIFLDEGFGTLDVDTLDVVATAIEELGSSGRVVGLISHVRELAERVPVRFEVTKGPTTSTVVRVDR